MQKKIFRYITRNDLINGLLFTPLSGSNTKKNKYLSYIITCTGGVTRLPLPEQTVPAQFKISKAWVLLPSD